MSASIQDIYKKLKAFISDDGYFYTLLIITVSLLSFGLGRLSVQKAEIPAKQPIVLLEQSAVIAKSGKNISTSSVEVLQNFVASKKGTRYHLLTCPGAKQMSEKNKIYFSTEAEAQAAGYTRAKNCNF